MHSHPPFPLPMPKTSTLVVIDVQDRLVPAMDKEAVAAFMRATKLLISLYAHEGGPILVTEQYPKGLGKTVDEVSGALPDSCRMFEKRAFSALREPTDAPLTFERDVIIVGMEAHVCVLQTALDLIARGHRVFVVEDGVISRRARDAAAGLAFLRDAGAWVIGCESLVFAAIERAEGETFKMLSAAIR